MFHDSNQIGYKVSKKKILTQSHSRMKKKDSGDSKSTYTFTVIII